MRMSVLASGAFSSTRSPVSSRRCRPCGVVDRTNIEAFPRAIPDASVLHLGPLGQIFCGLQQGLGGLESIFCASEDAWSARGRISGLAGQSRGRRKSSCEPRHRSRAPADKTRAHGMNPGAVRMNLGGSRVSSAACLGGLRVLVWRLRAVRRKFSCGGCNR